VAEFADDVDAAVADVADGSTVMIGGFGTAGQPVELIEALVRQGASGEAARPGEVGVLDASSPRSGASR
jgi:acyl CoA:acetate/3-ketoacid CoA transferase alpha subunit